MTEPSSMWGKLPVDARMRPPISFLREQAAALTTETRGLLQGKVVTMEADPPALQAALDIVAPSLNGYRVRVVTISHGLTFYPVLVRGVVAGQALNANSEAMFQSALRTMLSNAKVHNVIGALISQINATDAPSERPATDVSPERPVSGAEG